MGKQKTAVERNAHQNQENGVRHLMSVFRKTTMVSAGCMPQKLPGQQQKAPSKSKGMKSLSTILQKHLKFLPTSFR